MSDFVSTSCRCGAFVVQSPRSTVEALCMECRRAECGIDWPWFSAVGQWHPTVGYASPGSGHAMFNPWSDLIAEPFPAPVTTSRQASGMFPAPGSVMKLAEFAREHSWEVRTQYSQGCMPHAITGRPGALKDLVGLRFGAHPMTDRQAYAVYSRNASDGTWTWSSIAIWGPDLSPYLGCGITELKAYLMMCADSSAEGLIAWIDDLKSIQANGIALRKARPKVPTKPREDHA